MIRVDRQRLDPQGKPIRPDADWFTLADDATRRANDERGAHIVAQSIYRHPQVVLALEELFHRKCAYCESDLGNSTWDVEHFRPKGRVAERSDHPGYYWLAYQWTNFFPACELCNQRRKDRPLWGDLRFARTAGKADQFPLADENTRAMGPQSEVGAESRLLLDPCGDNPENHLRYDAGGRIYAAGGSAQGAASIAVFHLDRRLSDQRKEKIVDVVRLLAIITAQEKAGKREAVADLTGFLEDRYLRASCHYAGAARLVQRDPTAFGLSVP